MVIGPWAFLLLLTGCHRAPQTAAELRERLPRRWQGEVQTQGEQGGGRISLEVRELTVRSEHLLEFNRVRWQALAGGEVIAQDEATVRGTITAPGGVIRLDEDGTNMGESLRPGTFRGTLGQDLQSVEATWTTGSDGPASLKLHASPP